MKAIQLRDGKLELNTDAPVPTCPDGSVLVRVIQAGICETDLQLVAGYMGFAGTLGHEFVGIAESGRFAGQRVVGEINCICNQCDFCKQGHGNHCPNRSVIGILNHDGAFADYLSVPEQNLHAVPDGLSDNLATLVEPVAAALQIEEQVDIAGIETCYVVGDGRLGNLCAQVLQRSGCRVTVVGKHPEKRERFKQLDLDTCLLQASSSLPPADLVVDCAGTNSGLQTALSLVRPRGTVIMKTTVADAHSLSLASVVIDEVTLVGSRCGPFEKAIDALANGQFQLDHFISGQYPIDAYQEAFECATRKDALKVILTIGASA